MPSSSRRENICQRMFQSNVLFKLDVLHPTIQWGALCPCYIVVGPHNMIQRDAMCSVVSSKMVRLGAGFVL